MFYSLKVRRTLARFMLPVFLVWSVAVPRPAHAALPLAVALGVSFLDAVGTMTVADMAGAAATGLIGGAALGLILATPGDTSNVNGQVRVPLTSTAPSAVIPAPAANPTAPGQTAVQWSIGGTLISSIAAGAAGSTPESYAAWATPTACPSNSWVNGVHMICDGALSVIYDSALSATIWKPRILDAANGSQLYPSSVYTGASGANVSACPAGYTLSGSTCNLTNARAATPDKKQDFQRTGSAFSPFTGDDLPSGFSGAVSTTSTANDTVAISGVDAAGNPTRIAIQALSTGGSLVSQAVQRVDANGATYTHHRIVGVSGSGSVISDSSNDTAQTLTHNPATQQYDLAGNATPVAPSQSAAVTIPTDYARSGEAAAAAAAIVAAQVADSATVPIAAQDATLQAALAAKAAVPADIEAVPDSSPVTPVSLFQPFQPAACQVIGFTYGTAAIGGPYSINYDICPYAQNIKNVFAWCLYLLTAALLFQMVTRRPDSGE